jgi:hypothetical protein
MEFRQRRPDEESAVLRTDISQFRATVVLSDDCFGPSASMIHRPNSCREMRLQ